jgi:hypothetical protein
MTASKLDFQLTPLEKQLIQKLRCHLTVEMKDKFTSDDFRMLGLDRFVPWDFTLEEYKSLKESIDIVEKLAQKEF